MFLFRQDPLCAALVLIRAQQCVFHAGKTLAHRAIFRQAARDEQGGEGQGVERTRAQGSRVGPTVSRGRRGGSVGEK